MKSSVTPLNVALDAVALVLEIFGWASVVWLPMMALCALLLPAVREAVGTIQLLVLALLFPLLGLLLKWLARGVLGRKRVRMVLLSIALAYLGVSPFLVLIFLDRGSAGRVFVLSVQGVAYLVAAAVVALGLTARARLPEG